MVSMQPYTQRYDFSYQYMPSLCKQEQKLPVNKTTIFETLKQSGRFSKTVYLILKANMSEYLSNLFYSDGYTLFVTDDDNIPDVFVSNIEI